MINLINMILGGALLVTGRKLFWLFVGAVGFMTGIQVAARFSQGPEPFALITGIVFGIVFALLAVFLQTIAIGVAGFFSGAFVLASLASMLGLDSGSSSLFIYLIGGIIGVALVIFLFDWAVITLSSLAGASLIVQAIVSERAAGGLLFIVLFVIGILIQGSALRNEKNAGI